MKKLILILLLTSPLMADTTLDVPGLGILNLTNFVSNTGGVDTYDNHGVNRAGVTTRLLWYPNDNANPSNAADQAWIGLEGLISWDTSTGKPGGLGVWYGFRADTLTTKIFGPVPKVGHISVPDIEFGPMGMYVDTNAPGQKWVWGGALAKHF